MTMNCSMELLAVDSPYELLFKAVLLIPISHYLLGLLFVLIVFLYNFLEMHVLGDLFTGFRGQPVSLTFNSSSRVYHDVISKCKILHGRYLATPWLCSPHLQTGFLHFFGRPPVVDYKRQLFITSDGGTIALDWQTNADVKKQATQLNDAVQIDGKDPIMIVVPGLTSDSDSAYVKHLVFKMAKSGWNVVVSNHRGLGGVSITSDCLYNAGWTEDVRKVIDHLHCQYPEAPLFAVGTSIGANILIFCVASALHFSKLSTRFTATAGDPINWYQSINSGVDGTNFSKGFWTGCTRPFGFITILWGRYILVGIGGGEDFFQKSVIGDRENRGGNSMFSLATMELVSEGRSTTTCANLERIERVDA